MTTDKEELQILQSIQNQLIKVPNDIQSQNFMAYKWEIEMRIKELEEIKADPKLADKFNKILANIKRKQNRELGPLEIVPIESINIDYEENSKTGTIPSQPEEKNS